MVSFPITGSGSAASFTTDASGPVMPFSVTSVCGTVPAAKAVPVIMISAMHNELKMLSILFSNLIFFPLSILLLAAANDCHYYKSQQIKDNDSDIKSTFLV